MFLLLVVFLSPGYMPLTSLNGGTYQTKEGCEKAYYQIMKDTHYNERHLNHTCTDTSL